MAKSNKTKADIAKKLTDESPASTKVNSETEIDGFKVQRKKSNTRRKVTSNTSPDTVIVDEKKVSVTITELKIADDSKTDNSNVESVNSNAHQSSSNSSQKRKSTKVVKNEISEIENAEPKIESLNFSSIITFDSDDEIKVSDKIATESNTSTPRQANYIPNQNIQGRSQHQQNPNQIKQNPNQQKQNPNQIKQNPNQQKQNPNQIKQNPNQQKQNPNQIKQNPNQKAKVEDLVVNSELQTTVEQPKQNPNQIKQNPNQKKQNPNQIKQNPNQQKLNPNQKEKVEDLVVNSELQTTVEQPKQNPNQIKQNPNQIKQNPNQQKQNPNQIKQNPNKIKQNPNQKTKAEQTKQKPQSINAKNNKEDLKQDLQSKHTPKPIAREVLTYSLPDVKQLAPRLLKNPVIRKFLATIEDFLKTRIYIEKGFRIVLAVSGGVDSVVMLDCMALIADKLGLQIYIAHFNHMLREKESDLDAELVKNLAEQYNVQFLNSSGNVKAFSQKNNISIEHAARNLRYNFFERTTRNLDADLMATAHTSDDSVETFMLNLLRGSGLTGLSGIPEVRKFVKNVLIIRPLLAFSKKEIKNYAELRKLKWREDESNQLLNYTRNKIRLDLMPKLRADFNPAVDDIITRTARLIYGADNLIRELVKKHLLPVVVDVTPERFSLKVPILQTHEEFMQGEIIQAAWLKYFRLQPLSLSAVDRIMSIFDKQSGTQVEIGSGYFALKDRNIVIISKSSVIKKIKVFGSIPSEYRVNGYKIVFTLVDKRAVKIIENPEVEYFDYDKVGTYVEIRNWEQGDTFQPLGAPGEMKISDFLTNEKVTLLEKPNIIIVRNTYETVWVVGKRIGEKFKIDSETKKFLKAEIVQLK